MPAETDVSLGEFQALALKALRGAGYPWGVAEEGAAACRQLARWGIDPSASLLRLLTIVGGSAAHYWPDAELSTRSGNLCPFAVGSRLSDVADIERLELSALLEPLLIAPAMAVLGENGADYQLTWQGGSIVVARNGTAIEALFAEPGTPVTATLLRVSEVSAPVRYVATRITVSRDVLAQLERFAALTYAPDTDASREAGAGPS